MIAGQVVTVAAIAIGLSGFSRAGLSRTPPELSFAPRVPPSFQEGTKFPQAWPKQFREGFQSKVDRHDNFDDESLFGPETLTDLQAEAFPHQYPFLVSIQTSYNGTWYHSCLGSIINPDTILTSRLCVLFCGYDTCQVVAGAPDLDKNKKSQQIRSVKRGTSHPNFEGYGTQYDYGLLYTNRPLKLKPGEIEILPLPSSSPTPKESCISPDWDYEGGKLKTVNITLYPQETCEKLLGSRFVDGLICGYKPDQSQRLDSSGPLLCDGQLTGIVSWTYPPSGSPEFTALFSDVHPVLSWIKSKMKESCTNCCHWGEAMVK